MGSDDHSRRRSKIGIPTGTAPFRRWPSPLITEELSFETLQDTTYVRLLHPDDMMSICHHDAEEGAAVFEVSPKGTTRWSWFKRPVPWNGRDVGRDMKSTETTTTTSPRMVKSKSHNAVWAWLGRTPADEYQFDPNKRWPQGW